MKVLYNCVMLTLLFCVDCFSQVKFDNRVWEKCKVPIITVQTSIGFKQFIVDTGSSYSFIDYGFANKFCRFYRSINSEYCSINGVDVDKKSLYKVHILGKDHLMIGLNIKDIRYAVYPYDVIGILGSDFISSNKAIIDFNKREVTFNK